MADHRTNPEDFSLEEILADVRTSRGQSPQAEQTQPEEEIFDTEQPAADEPGAEPAPAEAPEPEQPKPATRRVPLYPERERPRQEPEEESPITAEYLADQEEELAEEGFAPAGRQRRGLRGLFSRARGQKKLKPAEPLPPEEDPYPNLRLKTRDEYKREYEQTMAFDSVPKSQEETPFGYLFHNDGGSAVEEGPELDEQMRRMREERRARIARVMEQAGLDGSEDIFSLYQKEEAQRVERETRDANAAAQVLEKAGGPEPEQEEPEAAPETQAEAVRRRAAEAARREEERFGWDEPSPLAKTGGGKKAAPPREETGWEDISSHSEPAADPIRVPQTEPEHEPGDGVMRVNRPRAQKGRQAGEQARGEGAASSAAQTPRAVPADELAARARAQKNARPAAQRQETENPWEEAAAQAAGAQAARASRERETGPAGESEGIVRVTRPQKAEQPSFRPAPPPVFLAEQEQEQAAPSAAQEEESAPVKEPSTAPLPAREPAPAPVREPEEKPQPRVLSGRDHREHSYRARTEAPARVLTMEETQRELEEALGNEARSYPRPGRLTSLKQDAKPGASAAAVPSGAAREAIASLEEEDGEPVILSGREESGEPAQERAGAAAEPESAPASAQGARQTGRGSQPRGRTIPLRPGTQNAAATAATAGSASSGRAGNAEKAEQDEPPVKRRPGKKKRRQRFSLFGTQEKDNRPEDEFPADPGELSDYAKPGDAPSIEHDLGQKRRSLLLRAGVTGLSLLLLLLFGLISEYSAILPAFIPYYLLTQPYLILELIFLLVAAGFSWQVLWNGVRGLVRLQANSDSAAAIAVAAAVVQTAVLLFTPERVESAALHLYAPLAALALFLNAMGKLSMVKRIARNFRFVASPDRKMAVHLLDDHNTALQMARGVVSDPPVIAYQTRTGFLRSFLRVSYLPDPMEQNAQIAAPIGIVCSLILCVATLLLSGDAVAALTAFTASCCVCTPMMNLLSVNLPLAQASRIAGRYGAMISGYQALDRFSDVNAILLDAKELFPKASVKISGVRTFGDQRVDEAILEAAAMLGEMGGTLGEIFDDVIQSRRELLPKVDSATYEDGKGISGWVSGHRVLVGNRALLEAHHITPPSRDFEKKNLVGDKQILYLASGGQLVAMFPLSYKTDRRRTVELCRLEDNGVSFLIRTCDPNITPELVARCFQLDAKSVNVLPTRLGNVYVEAGENPKAPATAWMATKGRPTALMRLLALCVRQRGNISLAVALQYVAVVLGFMLVAFLCCFSGLAKLSTLFLLLYELFWSLAIVILPRLRKP